jgi:hypothetical protein
MSYFSKRALRWAAPVALVGALGLAACGDSDDTEAVRVAAPSVAGLGSDQHLVNQAEELARASAGAGSDQHLVNQAEELARASAGAGSDQHLVNQAEELARASAGAGSDQHLNNQATELARQQRSYQAASARLTGQAEQYQRSVEAGNRAAQMAQAESYVQQQQDRAESGNGGAGDEFVPGSRHMPTR